MLVIGFSPLPKLSEKELIWFLKTKLLFLVSSRTMQPTMIKKF